MEKKKLRPIDPESPTWERHANILARTFGPEIIPCSKCRYPTVSGYCCTYCGNGR